MKRSGMVALGAALVLASTALAGCAEPDPDYDELCVDKETLVRVDDDQCDGRSNSHSWIYVPFSAGRSYPVGQKVSHPSASFTRPASGSFSRGGFGGSRGGGGARGGSGGG
jgi:hypothetical protein